MRQRTSLSTVAIEKFSMAQTHGCDDHALDVEQRSGTRSCQRVLSSSKPSESNGT